MQRSCNFHQVFIYLLWICCDDILTKILILARQQARSETQAASNSAGDVWNGICELHEQLIADAAKIPNNSM